MVHGPVREVVRGPGPLDWSTDRGSVFSGHPKSRTVVFSSRRKLGRKIESLDWEAQSIAKKHNLSDRDR